MGRKKKEGEEPKKPRRRDYGTGSISLLKDGRYRGSYYHEGRRHYVYTEKGANRSECQRLLQAAILKAERGELVAAEKITVAQYMQEWLKHRADYRTNTYVQREQAVRLYITPSIGQYLLQKLTLRHVQKYLAALRDANLGPGTVRIYMGVLHTALNDAVEAELIARNPATKIKLPPVKKKEQIVLDIDQANRFLHELEGHWLSPIITLALATAMRKAELLALRWSDINFKSGSLQIRHNFAYVSGQHAKDGQRFVEGAPKTEMSERKIVLPAFVLDVLKEHRLEQKKQRMASNEPWIDKDLVFCKSNGHFLSPGTLDSAFSTARDRAGLPPINFHGLRHSAASILLAMGVPPKVVQEILGHSSITMTMDLYGHVFPSQQEEAASKMHNAFSFGDKKEAK